jgi:hypothetical protein
MGIPYYPYTTCKDGSFKVGVSLSKFMKLISNGYIEASRREGKILLVNNNTLNNYIAKYGGREDRYKEYLRLQVYLFQEKEIVNMHTLIKKSGLKLDSGNNSFVTYHEFNAQDIVDFFYIVNIYKKNQKELKKLHKHGFTDAILEKYYEDEFFNINLDKNFTKTIFINEKIGNVKYKISTYTEFFKTYKSTLRKFKMIKFIKLSQIRPIVYEARKKFGF